MRAKVEEAVKRTFNPEFLNRIDDLIVFHQLGKEHMVKIVDIQMKRILEQMKQSGITIELSPEVKEFIADKGFDPQYGARPLNRALQRYVEDAVAEEVLKGTLKTGTHILGVLDAETKEPKFIEAPKEETHEAVEAAKNIIDGKGSSANEQPEESVDTHK
jgi:ATP-dependent Clp protease ATP-binding subunit ClpC